MGQFQKGQSGNPTGRPKGLLSARTKLFNELVAPAQKELIAKGLELARNGDPVMLRLFLERILPPKARNDESITVTLPLFENVNQNTQQMVLEEVLKGLADQPLTLDQVKAIIDMLKPRAEFVMNGNNNTEGTLTMLEEMRAKYKSAV